MVSVVVPTYNRATHLGRAIRSVLDQTIEDVELIVVNDGSTDYTTEVIDQFGDPRIQHVQHERNRGEAGARNTGIDNAEGNYVAFLDDDDRLRPRYIEHVLKVLEDEPEFAAAAVTIEVRKNDELEEIRRVDQTISGISKRTVGQHRIGGTAFRRDVIKELYPFRNFEGTVDLDMWIRLLRRYAIRGVDKPLYVYTKHGDQITAYTDASVTGYREVLNHHRDLPIDVEVDLRYTLGHALARRGEFDAAAKEFGRIRRLDPDNPRGHYYHAASIASELVDDHLFEYARFAVSLANGQNTEFPHRPGKKARRQLWQTMARLDEATSISQQYPDSSNRVIMYHAVGRAYNQYAIDPGRFRQDLAYITSRYELVDLPEVVEDETGAKRVALTFDDGTEDFHSNVLPILEEFDAPATVFVIARTLEDPRFTHDADVEYSYMSMDQLSDLISHDLVTIGNHTRTHPNLTAVNDDVVLREEIIGAKQILENNLDIDVTRFCYPYNQYDERSVDLVKESHDLAVAGQDWIRLNSTTNSPFLIPRVYGHYDHTRVRFDLTDAASSLASRFENPDIGIPV